MVFTPVRSAVTESPLMTSRARFAVRLVSPPAERIMTQAAAPTLAGHLLAVTWSYVKLLTQQIIGFNGEASGCLTQEPQRPIDAHDA